ncbi:MAG TPA: hypothetical protein VEY51_17735, partial [Chondromyces sp.]|nr:hypothetical protein [Chondromyces sp.]
AFLYVVSFALIACFFAFVPKKQLFFTNWGKNTLYVYLLHGFIIQLFRNSGLEDKAESVPLLLACSLLLAMLLSTSAVTTVTQPIIEANMSKWKKFLGRRKNGSRAPDKS